MAGEGTAALLPGVTSPVLAIGNRAIDLTPRPIKEIAIELLGAADKPALLGGISAVALVSVSALGALGVWRPKAAAGGFLGLIAVAAAAAVTDRAATAAWVLRLVPAVVAGGVTVAALALLLGAVRTWRLSDESRGETAVDRRRFLQAALGVGAVSVVGGATSLVGGRSAGADVASVRLPTPTDPAPALSPRTRLPVAGITPYLTPNTDFYRVDTALRIPRIPLEDWRLRIHGRVARERSYSFRDLLGRPLTERRITLTCVSNQVGGNLLGNAAWLGVPVRELLAECGVEDGADAVLSTSLDGMTIGTPLAALTDDRDALLAIGMNGDPLPPAHGFPARLVVPGLYGYVSATKWVVDLEVSRFADFSAYWTSRGYAAEAPIKPSSRIDVPRSFARIRPGRTPVAGVAWAQRRGIASVEVQVDDGPWSLARLAAEDGIDTWRQWVWEWDAQPGTHTLRVRLTDGDGRLQTEQRSPIAPDGSTGYDSVVVTVVGD